MGRLMIVISLLLLIIFVFLSYSILGDEGDQAIFSLDGDILIPVGVMEKVSQDPTMRFINPVIWVFLGMFLLLYLKIIWKLISFNWQNKDLSHEEKLKVDKRTQTSLSSDS